MSSRKKSSIINIRMFHNWVKSTSIKEAVDELNIKDISLLDLAVGRGGDMLKWYHAGIYNVVGIDIDDDSVKGENGAIHRYKKLLNRLRQRKQTMPRYEFYVFDLSDSDQSKLIRNKLGNRMFDIVSCQFAIHYFFRTRETLKLFIRLVSSRLRRGGLFIGSTLDGQTIMTLLDGKKKYSNDTFSVTLDNMTDTAYGNTYTVALGKKDDEDHYFVKKDSTEYLVDIEELKKVCKANNLMFIGTIPFDRWYQLYTSEDQDYLMSENEKKFSFLNFTFVFRKNL